jgi:predicted RNA-binding protein with PIN domain
MFKREEGTSLNRWAEYVLARGSAIMAVHVVIDGYNLIRQSATLSAQEELSLELGRDALLERLRQYKRVRRHRITVVFDAANKPLLAEERSQQKGIRIVYSGQGETADTVIKRICRKQGEKVLLVTTDRDLASYAEAQRSVAMDSEDFEARMEMALYVGAKGVEEEDDKERWHPDRGTGKKGPPKRQSKKKRRQRKKWQKI